MRIQDNLGLITWTTLDKALYFLFGFVTIFIFNNTSTYDFGLFSLLIFLNSWIFTVGDSFALNIIIQYGMVPNNSGKVNLVALINIFALAGLISFLVFVFQDYFAFVFNEPNLIQVAKLTPLLSISFIPRTFTLKLMFRDRNMKNVFLINLLFFGTITILVFYSIFQNISLTFSNLSFYYITGAIASSITGVLISFNKLIFSTKGNVKLSALYHFSWKIAYTNILHTIPKQVDIFIIKLFFATEIIGLYAAAKSLYRLFDEAINAIYGLLYPTSVKYIQLKDYNSLNSLINKSISFIFWIFALVSIFIISPLGDIILGWIFSSNYIQSLKYLKLMVIVTPFLSFISFYSIITAEGKLNYLFRGVLLANIGFFASLLTVCFTNAIDFLPFGLITFFAIFGITALFYGITQYNYKLRSLFVAFPDTYNFVKKIPIKKNDVD